MDAEINIPPPEFTDRLRELGGVNRYDEPNFKIEWSQYATYIAGGIWSVDEQYFKGYRRLLAGSGEPCWTLFQWHAPEEYGAPEAYYVQNIDEESRLQILGEYPYSGRYEVLYNLRWHEIIDGKITFQTIPLNMQTFDMIVPVVIAAKAVSVAKKKAAWEAAREAEEQEKLLGIERHLRDNSVPFSGGASFTRQGIRSSKVDERMIALQRQWQQLQQAAKKFRGGLQTR